MGQKCATAPPNLISCYATAKKVLVKLKPVEADLVIWILFIFQLSGLVLFMEPILKIFSHPRSFIWEFNKFLEHTSFNTIQIFACTSNVYRILKNVHIDGKLQRSNKSNFKVHFNSIVIFLFSIFINLCLHV